MDQNVIQVIFEPIFSKHKDYLVQEEITSKIELMLEEEYECYLKIKFSTEKRENIKEIIEMSENTFDDELSQKYAKDKKVHMLQTILGAKIRTTFSESPEVVYSLKDSCNFNGE